MTKEEFIQSRIDTLKEIQKEFRNNTNIDTAIKQYEAILKEIKQKQQ